MGTIVVIGAGLAGSLLASRLAGRHRVIVIEQAPHSAPLRIIERGRRPGLEPHVGMGFGGTTHLWHNGLIELEDGDYAGWPLAASELAPHIADAHAALSGASLTQVREIAAELRAGLAAAGVPQRLLGSPMLYPARRRNVWRAENPRGVETIIGRVERLALDGGGRVRAAVLFGNAEPILGDLFILAAGGLGSPAILQASAPGVFKNAGRFYFDHPVGFVGEVTLRADLNRLWNRFDRNLQGSVRLPLVVTMRGQKFAFYLRPAGPTALKAKSVLSDLRNNPYDVRHYLRLLMRSNDIVEALSLRAGINIPTRRFVLYMSAEQLPQEERAIAGTPGGATRDWRLGDDFLRTAGDAIAGLLDALAPITSRAKVFDHWAESLETAAHHCGTCRMAATAETGVVDKDGRAFGIRNLFVCDGSAIPAAGYANTGLTIGALALRLAESIHA
ncbi:MAG TPA: GMC oxidoreductase [Xanthobacteraceae bacterium]|nr:GMC oxidoreductase [Xanthobacteraceae bacterium]